MEVGDLPRVVAAEQRIYAFPWTLGNFSDSLAAGHRGWICHDQQGMAGYAVMMFVLDEAHLLNISVLPELQRKGIGSGLLEYLFAQARAAGVKRMFLEVRPSNASGQALYRRFGFSVVGERRDYYPALEGRENAIVMACDV